MSIPPKIEQLMRSEHAKRVNEMLDAGRSATEAHKYLASAGFSISRPTVYKYAEMRRGGLLEDAAAAQEAAAQARKEHDERMQQRLLTELEAIDALIDKGYQAVKEMDAREVSPRLLMDAIRLKNELTGGNHAFLTSYGYASIKKLDDQRWETVIEFLLSYIAEDRQNEVLRGIESIEESIYQGTPWYEEYLAARQRGCADGQREERETASGPEGAA